MGEVQQPAKPFLTRRRRVIFLVLLMLLTAYVGSYGYISRLRFEQYRRCGIQGFTYVSPESLTNDPESNWRIKDGVMAILYAPIHRCDEVVFDIPPYVCINMGIGQKKHKE